MKVVVQEAAFDPYAMVVAHEKTLPPSKHGGVVTFVGTMRDYNDGFDVSAMRLDHYPGMTEKHIEAVCNEAMERWDVMEAFVVHRYGEIRPSEAIVLVAVWSAHRADGFDACRFIINYLKKRAPFWKRESTVEGKRWVEHNSEDPAADLPEDKTLKSA